MRSTAIVRLHLCRPFALLGSVLALVAATATAIAAAEPAAVESEVVAELAAHGSADFWILFDEQADTSAASTIGDRAARGAYVYEQLTATAHRSQAATVAELERLGATFESFWIVNAILVRGGDEETLGAVRSRTEVDEVRAERPPEVLEGNVAAPRGISAGEWNLAAIRAPEVWSTFGVRGEGIVVATIDTGVQFDHPALVGKYRGNLGGGTFDHNYNWFDPSQVCSSPVPCDNNGFGTHLMGIMVGDDGGANQIGVAPGARWITAKGCETSSCSEAALLAAGQWIVAPTDLSGNNPRPDLAPDIVTIGWGAAGADPFFQATIDAWNAAGIFPVAMNGNSGPACVTSSWPANYLNVYSSGAFDSTGAIASFSSRGPSAAGEIKPNIAAPGVSVRSSGNLGNYVSLSGTAQAAAHVSGTIALMWSAAPVIKGDIASTRVILDATAVDVSNLTCGGTAADNNVWGEGKLDAFEAVEDSPRGPVGTLRGTVTDAAGGTPIAGATVEATGPSNQSRSTLADGSYSFTMLSVGSYDVSASAAGYTTAVTSAVVTEGGTTTQDFQLVAVLAPTPTSTSTPTPTATPTTTATPNPCGPENGDLDNDGIADVCDDTDASLALRRARIHQNAAGRGSIMVRGTLPLAPPADVLAPEQGLEIRIADASGFDRTFHFAPADCVRLDSGRVTCRRRDVDGRTSANFTPHGFPATSLRFAFEAERLTLQPPFAPVLTLRITDDPPGSPAGIDRVGSISDCVVRSSSIRCVAR